MSRVLIIEDEDGLREMLVFFFEKAGFYVNETSNGKDGIDLLKKNQYDIIITDLRLGDIDGLNVITLAKQISPKTEIILITAYGTIETAVSAIKKGAYDFITKPFEIDQLVLIVERALEKKKLVEKIETYLKELKDTFKFEDIICKSKEMIDILKTVTKVSPTDSTVLITGESGTGKELIAKAIHYNSNRQNKSPVILNCGAIPENLHESELFGHKKGAFTGALHDKTGLFEEAQESTILLDEIGELSLPAQVKLLRFLQNNEIRRIGDTETRIVDVRVVAMTNKNLQEEVASGRFRKDLYFRLNVIPIVIPPLRKRIADIAPLIDHFLKLHCKKLNRPLYSISRRVHNLMMSHSWPGNIRELSNLIERLIILSDTHVIEADMLPLEITGETTESSFSPLERRLTLEELEKEYINEVLDHVSGNKKKAVEWLGISRSTLYNKLSTTENIDVEG